MRLLQAERDLDEFEGVVMARCLTGDADDLLQLENILLRELAVAVDCGKNGRGGQVLLRRNAICTDFADLDQLFKCFERVAEPHHHLLRIFVKFHAVLKRVRQVDDVQCFQAHAAQ